MLGCLYGDWKHKQFSFVTNNMTLIFIFRILFECHLAHTLVKPLQCKYFKNILFGCEHIFCCNILTFFFLHSYLYTNNVEYVNFKWISSSYLQFHSNTHTLCKISFSKNNFLQPFPLQFRWMVNIIPLYSYAVVVVPVFIRVNEWE